METNAPACLEPATIAGGASPAIRAAMASRAIFNSTMRSSLVIVGRPEGPHCLPPSYRPSSLSEVPQGGGHVSDDPGLVAGDVAGVRVAENHRVARAERLCRAHDGDRRSAAACVIGPRVERALQSVGVEALHVLEHDGVEPS